MKDVDNVIAIATKLNEAAPVELLQERWDACRHQHTTLDNRLRTVACRDCGEERLDPFEVLSHLAHEWSRWHREAETLRKLNAEYYGNQKAAWDRARDRHLNANVGHRESFEAKVRAKSDPGMLAGHSRSEFDCDRCWSVFLRLDYRWLPRRAPEPPSGRLDP